MGKFHIVLRYPFRVLCNSLKVNFSAELLMGGRVQIAIIKNKFPQWLMLGNKGEVGRKGPQAIKA